MDTDTNLDMELRDRFGDAVVAVQATRDRIPTYWINRDDTKSVLRYLKTQTRPAYPMLYDLSAIDERLRRHRDEQPASDFTVVYHLLSFEGNRDVRIKVALTGDTPALPSITDTWPAANWYEREVWDMFGIRFDGHPYLRRILMPPTWSGHPLRKEHPARATEMGPYSLPDDKEDAEQEALRFQPEIIDAVPDIGYHHRGAEKMGERQSWHTYIPYTDRIDYLGGVMNNLPYVLAVEQLAGIEAPERARVIRVMMAEFFRIASHLVFYGTFAQDLGAMSPVFFMFTDRERVFDVVEAICGGRMHPSWFRIGGVAQDLPQGWDRLVRNFLDYLPARLDEYDDLVLGNRILQQRTRGIGAYDRDTAIEWGVTGPGLRACGYEWDFRKQRPYSGYEQFDFDVPIGNKGDCYDRCAVRAEEMRQSLRIIRQCLDNMPSGPYKAEHSLATPPLKERTMHDIETLITHFLGVSWGPRIPPGEAFVNVEATKGSNGYYLISDGDVMSYRTRIRTPSFPHLQLIPKMCRGRMIPDLIAILGSIDFVMADVDR